MMRRDRMAWQTAIPVVVIFIVARFAERMPAGEVTLKNGLVLTGVPRQLQALNPESIRHRENDTKIYPFVMVENGYQRLFVGQSQVDRVDDRDELAKYETFTLRQIKSGYRHASGQLIETSPFDENGHRTHTLATAQGRQEVVVGIKKLNPRYIAITGLTHQWDYGVATPSIPPAQLDKILRKLNHPKNPDHRFSIARFYLQAGFYEEAGKELDSIEKDFPELKNRVGDAKKELEDLEHRLVISELAHRKAAGQYELAHAYAMAVPQEKASASVLHDVQELLKDYDSAHERMARVRVLLGELQAKLDDKKQVAAVMPLRSVIDDQLTIESLERLQAFFNLVDDTTLRPAEKLALAYSGWVIGSASAVTDLGLAVRLWQAQHLILEYLRDENPSDRQDRLNDLAALDGMTPDIVVKLLRCLPPVIDTTEPIRPGQAGALKVAGRSSEDLPSYGVLLPPEYDYRHPYPMVVALHPAEHTAKAELDWWGGTLEKPGMAQRRGYIVIAPEYSDGKDGKYTYSVAVHDAVLRSIVDARRRFNVDSDRVFLSGHGMGADAAFDIGMSHPDVFAGVIPISGICDQFCKWYTENAGHTAWYVITGEFDGREPFSIDAPVMSKMMLKKADLLLVEFVQRGYEPYFEEIPRIFDWMELHRRQKPPREFSMRMLRPSESRFYWLQADGLPPSVLQPTLLAGGTPHPMTLGARVTATNLIRVLSGAKSHTLWLSADLVNFDKRLTIQLHGSQRYSGMLKPSVEAILDDYRLRADKQVIYTARVDIH